MVSHSQRSVGVRDGDCQDTSVAAVEPSTRPTAVPAKEGARAKGLPSAAESLTLPAPRLTDLLCRVNSTLALKQLLAVEDAQLNTIHVCAALHAAVRLYKSAHKQQARSVSGGHAPGSTPLFRAPVDERGEVRSVVAALCARMVLHLEDCRPWDIALATWACAQVSGNVSGCRWFGPRARRCRVVVTGVDQPFTGCHHTSFWV